MFSLQDLCEWTNGVIDASECIANPAEILLDGVETDTRNPLAGKLFVALKGESFNGNRFAEAAFKAGAVAALLDETAEFVGDATSIVVRVPDTHLALADLANGWRGRVSPWIVGLTGSVGKTTVKEITAAFLGVAESVFKTPGNWNNNFGVPKSLLAMPVETKCGVFETGTNHPGEISPLAKLLSPSAAILTNIAPCHIENFSNGLAGIADEKANLLRAVPESGFVVLDKDGEFFSYLSSQVVARVVTVCGRVGDASADYYATAFDPATGEATICCTRDGESVTLPTGLIGEHQLTNILQGVAVAHEYGISLAKLVAACPIKSEAKMRWEKQDKDGYHWINDAYNANPLSMSKSIETFAKITAPGRKIVVLGDMFELGADAPLFHRQVGEVVGRNAASFDLFVAVGACSKEQMVAGAISAGMPEAQVIGFATVSEARAALHTDLLKQGDTILIKASRGMTLEVLLKN